MRKTIQFLHEHKNKMKEKEGKPDASDRKRAVKKNV